MVKKIIILTFGIMFIFLLFIVGWHFLSPLFIDVEIQEEDIFANQVNIINQQHNEEKINTSLNNNSEKEKIKLEIEEFPKLIKEGNFERIDYNIEGSFKVYQLKNLSYILRVENIDVINGPDLHFVLTNEWNDSLNDYVKISGPDVDGEKFANKGSYNIEVPKDINIEEFDNLIIHCVQYNHAFAGARLN